MDNIALVLASCIIFMYMINYLLVIFKTEQYKSEELSMHKLLIVSDNRMVARRIVNSLQDKSDISIYTEFNSSAVFDAYLSRRPDAILFYNENFIPLASVIKRFSSYHWDCPIAVVYEKEYQEPVLTDVMYIYLQTDEINRGVEHLLFSSEEKLHGKEDDLPDRAVPGLFEWNDGEPLSSGQYSFMLSVCMNQGRIISDEMLCDFKSQLQGIGIPSSVKLIGSKILIVMKKSDIRVQGSFPEVHTAVCKAIDSHIASIYCEDISAEEADEIYKQLTEYSRLCLFFDFECVRLEDLRVRYASRHNTDVYSEIIQMLKGLFSKQATLVHSALYRVYLINFKRNLDLEGLETFECWSSFFLKTIFAGYTDLLPEKALKSSSLELRYKKAAECWNEVYLQYMSNPFLPVVYDSVMLLLREYKNPAFSLENAAEEVGFSKTYISRIFKRQTGFSFIELLQKLRIEHACRLLESSEETIKNISNQVGYPDSLYFSRLFKKHCGIYPTQYRQNMLGEEKSYDGTCENCSHSSRT